MLDKITLLYTNNQSTNSPIINTFLTGALLKSQLLQQILLNNR